MVKTKETNVRIYSPFLLVLVILIVGLLYIFNSDEAQDIRSRAEDDEANYCEKNCGGDRDPCTGTNIGDNYYDSGCCADIKKTGDPFACGNWVNRTWCFPDDCTTIPEGVKTQRCAGARTEYCNRCKSHGCYNIPSSVPTLVPTIVQPTQVVPPTSVPIPTEIIIPPTNPPIPTQVTQPTQVVEPPQTRPQITYVPIIIPPYTPPTLTPTPTPFKFTLPNILPPKEKVQSFWERVRFNLFNFFSKVLP